MKSRTSSRRLARAAALSAVVAVAPGALAAKVSAANSAAPDSAVVANGVLTITADDGANDVAVVLGADPNQLQVSIDQTFSQAFDRTQFTQIVIDALGGDDRVSVGNGFSDEQVTIDGGDGNDTLLGGDGNDLLLGGDGNDFVDGNRGADTAFLGSGDDTFQWDPGDGSDVVEGQDGGDTMVFNGANIAEQMAVSANGQRVRFTRDVGAITMDLDGVERLGVRALGGADKITVGDLTGTDLTAANIDLASSAGGGDASADQVIVQGTAGDDSLDAASTPDSARIAGLAAVTTVSGAETALDSVTVDGTAGTDQLTVAGTAGNDTITASPGTAAGLVATTVDGGLVVQSSNEKLVLDGQAGDDTINASNGIATATQLTLDGGDGNDTLLGGDGNDTLLGGDGNDFADGNRGADTAFLGAGDDTFQWDPGDGSDVVEGQGGIDEMAFNGANIAEQMSVSANGGRVLFTRDVGTITMDLDGVERLAVRALGGADKITVGDLTGTDLTAANIDLSSSIGGGDTSADQVTLTGTARRDKVSVTASAGAVTVSGLPATVTVGGTDPAVDSLQVNTVGGKDKIKVAGDVSTVIQIGIDEGGR